MNQNLGSLLGMWQCRNGQFVLISKVVGTRFTGHIFVEYKKDELAKPELVPLLARSWGEDGNCVGAGREYDLFERKIGDQIRTKSGVIWPTAARSDQS